MLSELSEMYTREHSSNKSSIDPTRNHPRGTTWWQIPHGPWEDLLEIEPHWTIITLLSFTAFLFLFLSFHMASWRHFPNKLLASTGLPCIWFQGHRDGNLNQDTYLLIFFHWHLLNSCSVRDIFHLWCPSPQKPLSHHYNTHFTDDKLKSREFNRIIYKS